MQNFALVGKSLKHSFSKQYFDSKFKQEKIEASFFLFEIERIQEVKPLISSHNLNGLAITIPFKEQILNEVDVIDDKALQIGAANCVCIWGNKLYAYNTDEIGFNQSFIIPYSPHSFKQALILGNGGAAKAVKFVLQQHNIPYYTVGRTSKEDLRYHELTSEIIKSCNLIINTTPVGTYPNINESIHIPFEHIGQQHFCFDLIYNPAITAFLYRCQQQGATIKNGYEMLVLQAEANFALWQKKNF